MILRQLTKSRFGSIAITFVLRDGSHKLVHACQGQHLLELAKNNDVELQGACEASLACSTCHVILPPELYQTIDPAKEEEEDLLDLAFGLTGTSRLGCQVKVSQSFEGKVITLPSASRNLYVDGTKPSSH